MLLILNKLLRLFAIFTLIFCSKANSFDYDNLSIHGFLSQGYIKTTGNNYLGDTTGGSFDFTEASLNLHYRPFNRVHFSTQMLHRNVGESETFVSFDYAFVGINLFTSENFEANYMYGRTKIPWGLFHDTRDVPFSHVGVLLDQAMYNEHARAGILSTNGSKIDLKLFSGIGEFKLEWSYPHDIPGSSDDFTNKNINGIPGIIEVIDTDFQAAQYSRLSYFSPDNSLQTSISWSNQSQYNYTTYLTQLAATQIGRNINKLKALSISYKPNNWQLTIEAFQINYNINLRLEFDAPIPAQEINQQTHDKGYYIQASYQYDSHISLFSRFSNVNFYSAIRPLDTGYEYTRNITCGIDWQINQNLILKSELHRISGKFILNPLENSNIETKDHWNMFLSQISYRF